MNDDKTGRPPSPDSYPETKDQNFQLALRELLAGYQPILEEELKRVKSPEQTEVSEIRDCEEELQLANRIFERFAAEKVALSFLPEEARKLAGETGATRWCLLYIRCCLIFGWLVCRGPRSFKAWSYYLHLYWICVRRILGTPVGTPPTAAEREDFASLVKSLAEAFKPYLTDQLATVEFSEGIPGEVLAGTIDCFTGEAEICQIFQRLLNTGATRALLGEAAFKERTGDQTFWFCRCWCLCALCLGCCLARVRSVREIKRCLVFYSRCLRDCFRPLICDLTSPANCVQETAFPGVGVFRGVEITGTAAGAFCDHYTLEWRQGIGLWQSGGIVYPGGAAQGSCGVFGGVLGYLKTFPLVAPGLVEIRLTVFSSQPNVAPCVHTIFFELQRNLVWIEGIEGINAAVPPGVFDPSAQLVDGAGNVRSFGSALRVFGSASVGGCNGQNIKRYTLSYQQGFTTTTAGAWTQFWEVDYNTPFQIDTTLNQIFQGVLTSQWEEMPFCYVNPLPSPHVQCDVASDYLSEVYWSTQVPGGPFALQFPDPPGPYPDAPAGTWNSAPLALPNCQSGPYTLRLTVEDTGGNKTDDLQQVWFDNKNIYGEISQISSVPACTTIELSSFSGNSPDCGKAWPAPLLGIAYDEYILEGNTTAPSDNFGGYSLEIYKAGGSWHSIPIPGPAGHIPWPPASPPLSFVGTNRIGDPGVRCANAVPPPGPIPPKTDGILTMLDMRRLDAVCNTNPLESDLVLQRGECCGFIIHLSVWDTSVCPSLGGGRHQADIYFPFCICNDLPNTAGK